MFIPNFVAFSSYLWNCSYLQDLIQIFLRLLVFASLTGFLLQSAFYHQGAVWMTDSQQDCAKCVNIHFLSKLLIFHQFIYLFWPLAVCHTQTGMMQITQMQNQVVQGSVQHQKITAPEWYDQMQTEPIWMMYSIESLAA